MPEEKPLTGTIYTRREDNTWVKVVLDTGEVTILNSLPFEPPAPPIPPKKFRFTGVSVEQYYKDIRIAEGLRAIKGKISEADYNEIWANVRQTWEQERTVEEDGAK